MLKDHTFGLSSMPVTPLHGSIDAPSMSHAVMQHMQWKSVWMETVRFISRACSVG